MGSRAAGGLLLVLAVTASVASARLTNPQELAGRAVVEPPAPPLTVQTCITEVPAQQQWQSSGQLTVVASQLTVPCDAPHGGEVFYVYDRLISLTGNPSEQPALCMEPGSDADTYLGSGPTGGSDDTWQPRLRYQVTLIGPDQRQLAAGQAWSACVLSPGLYAGDDTRGRLSQSLRGVLTGGPVASEMGWCLTGDTSAAAADIPVTCTLGHTTEIFATPPEQPDAGVTVDALLPSCRDLVTQSTQRPSLVDDPDLSITVTMIAFSDSGAYPVQAVPASGFTDISCGVRAKPGRALTGTLRGVGDSPVRWVA